MNCLFGYTGFVGSNMLKQSNLFFDSLINSKNTENFQGEFENIYFCGARAEKWKANQNPKEDLEHINFLIKIIKNIKCKNFYLISTIDVYDKNFLNQDEDGEYYTDDPYGKHRKKLENFCFDNYNTSIIRLPALFGDNLKKNFLYDLIHNNNLENFNYNNLYQWYNLNNIFFDIENIKNKKIKLINLFSEPISIEEILIFLNKKNIKNIMKNKNIVKYQYNSKYNLIKKQIILKDIREFYEKNSMHNY
jgi:nucleoside-diphosphate-sugar epimerase